MWTEGGFPTLDTSRKGERGWNEGMDLTGEAAWIAETLRTAEAFG
jgi:hypothetical protein